MSPGTNSGTMVRSAGRVLSVAKLRVGQEAYRLSGVAQSLDAYYTGAGEAAGRWIGAERHLGLSGEVTPGDHLRAVLAGMAPGSGGLNPNGETIRPHPRRVPGFDLTFNTPKSVSVLYPVSDHPRVGRARSSTPARPQCAKPWACWRAKGCTPGAARGTRRSLSNRPLPGGHEPVTTNATRLVVGRQPTGAPMARQNTASAMTRVPSSRARLALPDWLSGSATTSRSRPLLTPPFTIRPA